MKKTIVELFAGVGGFRVGFENNSKQWKTVWANQWEPNRTSQHAYDCYKKHFGKAGGVNELTNVDIAEVDVKDIPDHTLIVGGFPCQDYSVAGGIRKKGIKGKKGVLWWEIERILKAKKPPFILLENVDRLLKSPASQRGRDFAIMLAVLKKLNYGVEWRVINAAEYGLQQRRRRVFIFGFHKDTNYYKTITKDFKSIIDKEGFFIEKFPIEPLNELLEVRMTLSDNLIDISNNHKQRFENSGVMMNGKVLTIKTKAQKDISIKPKTLKDLMESGKLDEKYFLNEDTYKKFEYMKGAKKKERTTKTGFKYFFSEGAVPFPDIIERAARTMLTSESSTNRSTHIVKDKITGRLRKLTPIETERINGFPDNWTDTGMTERFRYFCMGNALVVNLITILASCLEKIVDMED